MYNRLRRDKRSLNNCSNCGHRLKDYTLEDKEKLKQAQKLRLCSNCAFFYKG